MQLKKRRRSLPGEDLQWTDYMSLSFTQDVSRVFTFSQMDESTIDNLFVLVE